MKIAHIVNPVNVSEKSDLYIAQPIVFESMRRAKDYAEAAGIHVDLYYTCYEEDQAIAPAQFEDAGLLTRSVLDVGDFTNKRKLPFIKDILNKLDKDSLDYDYIVYTNTDIILMPFFYKAVSSIIQSGHDAFVVNRRTIDDKYTAINELELMYAEVGEQHRGYDCFIFKKEHLSSFVLNDICVGAKWIGTVLLWNLQSHAKNFNIFKDLHLTLHLGNDKAWKDPKFDQYALHNGREAKQIYSELQMKHSHFSDSKHENLLTKNSDKKPNIFKAGFKALNNKIKKH